MALILLLIACRPDPGESLPEPDMVLEQPPATAEETLAALTAADPPERDLVALAERLGGAVDPPRTVAEPATSRVGDVVTFWYLDHDAGGYRQANARLAYQSEALNMWVEESARFDEEKLREAAEYLESRILPANRALFGDEWQPGVDGDVRLNILHMDRLGEGIVGYFVAADEFTNAVKEHSNQRELLYANLEHAPIGEGPYYELIAHEFQHMIHWAADSNESTWVNEGMAVLAAFQNGYPSAGYEEAFAAAPDVQLNDFSYGTPLTGAQYGAAFYFTAYLLERYGEPAIRQLLDEPANGLSGVEALLAVIDPGVELEALFADWTVANYLDSRGRGEGVYAYERLDLPELSVAGVVQRFPAEGTDAVHQYAADYIEIESDRPVTVVFTGTQQTRLLDTEPYSGDYFWTTLPADSSDMTLTGRFDLSGLSEATLTFQHWYDIEENWDYAYVTASTDGGNSWQLLESAGMTRDNPNDNSYGPAFTGVSGGGDAPNWVQESIDLTPFAGGELLVQFEYITDDATHAPGWAIDDIAIPQLGFLDDVEDDDVNGQWQPAGFVRHTNVLPQDFILQAILLGESSVTVEALPLDENRRGNWILPLDNTTDRAILVVSAVTPFTKQRATYRYTITR